MHKVAKYAIIYLNEPELSPDEEFFRCSHSELAELAEKSIVTLENMCGGNLPFAVCALIEKDLYEEALFHVVKGRRRRPWFSHTHRPPFGWLFIVDRRWRDEPEMPKQVYAMCPGKYAKAERLAMLSIPKACCIDTAIPLTRKHFLAIQQIYHGKEVPR